MSSSSSTECSDDSTTLAVKASKSAPSISNFTNTFVFSSTSNLEQGLFEIPKALTVDPFRQRRAHQKSRRGCDNCRRRRVKCNEENPCDTCFRRGERCRRPGQSNGATDIHSMPTQTLVHSAGSMDAAVNLLHMKLFHHFQTYTRQTLSLTPEVWGHALQLSFEYEFLMNAVLCVSARHLAALNPEDATYAKVATSQVCRASSQFRHNLANHFAATHVDVFIATSLLLQYAIWADTDILSQQNINADHTASFDSLSDDIFAISSGLKQVFLKCLQHAHSQQSAFMPVLRYDPRPPLIEAAQITNGTLSKYQDFFSYSRPLTLESLDIPFPCPQDTGLAFTTTWQERGPNTQISTDPIKDGYLPVITRLSLLLSLLPEARSPSHVTSSMLVPDLARFTFLFPVWCYGSFAAMVQRGDPHALLLVYHFYRAARMLLPPTECWWAHGRAVAAENILRRWLTNLIVTQVDV